MALLLSLSVLSYFIWATRLFSADKTTYIYQSSAAISKNIALQTKSKIEEALVQIYPILDGYNAATEKFNQGALQVWRNQDTIEEITVFKKTDEGYKSTAQFLKARGGIVQPDMQASLKSVSQDGIGFRVLDASSHLVMLSSAERDRISQKDFVGVAVMKIERFFSLFQNDRVFSHFLINSGGQIILSADDHKAAIIGSSLSSLFEDPGRPPVEGTSEISTSDQNQYLVSYSKTGVADLYVASLVEKKQAFQNLRDLERKSIVFIVLLLPLAVLVTFLTSNYLTSTLRDLYQATRKVGAGHFDVHVPVRSKDEVGGLARGFNEMSKEVSRLLVETAEKARMEKELQLAHTVQDSVPLIWRLFTIPPMNAAEIGGTTMRQATNFSCGQGMPLGMGSPPL